MKIVSVGGGPAGLYFAILIRKAFPEVSVRVLERNRPDDTFGWGVVFSDETLENFEISMRLQLEGIGAALTTQDGYVVVSEVIPGGAAARDGTLKATDKILAAAVSNPGIVKIPSVYVQGQSGGFEGPAAILGASNLVQSIAGGREEEAERPPAQ